MNVSAGSAFDVPLVLALASFTEKIEIVDEAPVIDTSRSQLAATVFDGEVQSLPMNGRNFLDLALLVPGVAPAMSSTQLFPETSVPGVTLSVGSQRNLSNNFVVDGLSANDDAAGLGGITFAVDAIEQFQVVTSGAQAELGRALGGYINVVTKSGNNTTRGTVYSISVTIASTPPMRCRGRRCRCVNRNSAAASVGRSSPIALLLWQYRAHALDQTGLVTIGDASTTAINAHLRAVNYGGTGATTGLYDNPVSSTNVLTKIDQSFGARGLVSAL